MIEIQALPQGKYLLGFSGGVDSSALFFLLSERGVEFDVAIVDYGIREQSKEEVAYAQTLAQYYKKQCHCIQAPKFQSNFEARAREFRYSFFLELIKREKYSGLLLAHQLDDRLEWMMMQFCKGAGLNSMLGFDFVQEREGCLLYRPLWKVSKARLYEYCKEKGIKYFEDTSNKEEKYTRNFFRKILTPLFPFHKGILRSFEYLLEEKARLYPQSKCSELGEICSFERLGGMRDIYTLDLLLKERGYLISTKQREEICKSNFSCEIAGVWVVESDWRKIYLAPKQEALMDKGFREFARKLSIPPKIRSNVYKSAKSQEEIEKFFA